MTVDVREFNRLLAEAQAKLDPGSLSGSAGAQGSGDEGLSRREQLILLAGLLMGQATRKEKGYGQA